MYDIVPVQKLFQIWQKYNHDKYRQARRLRQFIEALCVPDIIYDVKKKEKKKKTKKKRKIKNLKILSGFRFKNTIIRVLACLILMYNLFILFLLHCSRVFFIISFV